MRREGFYGLTLLNICRVIAISVNDIIKRFASMKQRKNKLVLRHMLKNILLVFFLYFIKYKTIVNSIGYIFYYIFNYYE